MSNNPLTQDQQDRVNAYLAENLFGWIRIHYPSQKNARLIHPKRRTSEFRKAITTAGFGVQYPVDGDGGFPLIPRVFDDIPRFTSPASPRRLLRDAIRATVESVGEDRWVAALHSVAARIPMAPCTGYYSLGTVCYVSAMPESEICQAIVLALGGKWSEVIGE